MRDLKQLQLMDLDFKIWHTERKIKEFHEKMKNTYVAFSGGKDSTVLLHLVRKLYPNTKAVFIDTGLEYPEVKEFVNTIDNVEIIKPKLTFKQVIDTYGYPVISKEQSKYIYDAKTSGSEHIRDIRLNGKQFNISKKWKFLVDAPFKISDMCCNKLKKDPAKIYENENNIYPFIGIMAGDSSLRKSSWQKYGCNSFQTKRITSRPIMIWTEDDIWEYIKSNNINYSKIYDIGYENTGCMFCMYGIQSGNNKFEIMKTTHPQLYNYCMKTLGIEDILKYINNKGK